MSRDNSYLIGNKFAKGAPPNKTAFKAGSTPWNKGIRGIMKPNAGTFKKGQRGINHLPIGTKTIRTDKSGKKRRFIKIEEPNKWIEYAKLVWLNHNGEIPSGLLIHHIDGNTLNDSIDNLSLLTRKAHFIIHGIGALGRAARADRFRQRGNN